MDFFDGLALHGLPARRAFLPSQVLPARGNGLAGDGRQLFHNQLLRPGKGPGLVVAQAQRPHGVVGPDQQRCPHVELHRKALGRVPLGRLIGLTDVVEHHGAVVLHGQRAQRGLPRERAQVRYPVRRRKVYPRLVYQGEESHGQINSQAPAHFAQVVLLTPSPCYLNEPGYYGGYERADLEQLLTLLATDYHSWATLFVDLLLGPLASSGLAEELHPCLSPTASPMAQQFARVTFLSDHRADVPRLHLPTLVVQCQQDFIAPAEVGGYLVAHLPTAQLVTLSAAGHCPQLSAPLETLAALRAFLR